MKTQKSGGDDYLRALYFVGSTLFATPILGAFLMLLMIVIFSLLALIISNFALVQIVAATDSSPDIARTEKLIIVVGALILVGILGTLYWHYRRNRETRKRPSKNLVEKNMGK